MKRKILCLAVAFLMLCSALALFAGAVSTADAREKLQTGRLCSLTVNCLRDGEPVSDIDVNIYFVGSINQDLLITPTNDFVNAHIGLNGYDFSDEWNTVMSTVEAYITADKITPYLHFKTDKDGRAVFDRLICGLYYVAPKSDFAPFLVLVPALNENGYFEYETASYPKPLPKSEEPITPTEYTDYKVIKQWKDEGKARPESVTAEIYVDGEKYETVTLSDENNWAHSFKVESDKSVTVVERNVNERYRVSVEKLENTFVITNNEVIEAPKTSDMNITVFVIAAFAAVIAAGSAIMLKRKNAVG